MKDRPIQQPDGSFKSQAIHKMTRRAQFHDYCSAGTYMFTIFKHSDAPMFSNVSGNPRIETGADAPRVDLLPVGEILEAELIKTKQWRRNELDFITYVIMPDHAHILLELKWRRKSPVTKIISAIESATTSRCRAEGLVGPTMSIFKGSGINDKIVFDETRLATLIHYIKDNPRRLLIKRMYPDLFRINLKVRINDDLIDCIGNMFLLRKPLMAVHIRRKWSKETSEKYKSKCVDNALQGYVLVSPFIHPVEREIMKEALDNGGAVVRVVDYGFGERFKPAGRSFDLCSEGRLLLISESGASENREDMSYAKACRLNALAERIASIYPVSSMEIKMGAK